MSDNERYILKKTLMVRTRERSEIKTYTGEGDSLILCCSVFRVVSEDREMQSEIRESRQSRGRETTRKDLKVGENEIVK